MDGSINTTLAQKGVECATSLTYDYMSHRLHWIDAGMGTITSVLPSNANRRVNYLDKDSFPQGFAWNGKYAFLTDEGLGRIYRIGLKDKTNVTLASSLTKPTLVRYYDTSQIMNGKVF